MLLMLCILDIASVKIYNVDLEQVDENSYKLHKVEEDCGLSEFFEKHNIEFCRGCAFFEFQNKIEDIHRNSRIILINKSTDKYYSGEAARKLVHLLPSPEESKESEIELEIKRPDHLFENYRVFIQDRGLGTRYLHKGSTLLIQEEGLEEVPSGRFLWFSVEEDCELLTFIESQMDPHQPDKKLVFHRGNAFYEFSHESEDITGKKEVVLMNVKTKILYMGERAKIMLGIPGKGIRNPYKDKEKWRVFVQSSCTGKRDLDKGTIVLYENDIKLLESNPSSSSVFMAEVKEHYEIMDVAEDCSLQLRTFVEEKGKEYARGCSYYELADKEVVDIDSGKEVMLMNEEKQFFSGKAASRKIGAPGINLKNPKLPKYSRVFIRCSGPGYNVYIRKGTSVLYKDPKTPDLIPVNLEDFYRFEVLQTCELRRFVEQELQNLHRNIAYKKGNAYFEFTCATEDIENKKEVLLMDKEGKLFTGPAACRMIEAPGKGIPQPGPDFKYKVFIQNWSRGSRCLIKGSVLYYKKD